MRRADVHAENARRAARELRYRDGDRIELGRVRELAPHLEVDELGYVRDPRVALAPRRRRART